MCQHLNYVIDEHEGTHVCIDCGLVLLEAIMMSDKISNHNHLDITYDKYYDFIMESCARMHIIDDYASKSFDYFDKYRYDKQFQHVLFALAAYSIYNVLKLEKVARSLKFVSSYTNVSLKQLWYVETRITSTPLPIDVSQLLNSKFYLFDLNFKHQKELLMISTNFKNRSFSPNTLASSMIYLYCKQKKIKLNLKKTADIFQISTMSMYRCNKFLKAQDF